MSFRCEHTGKVVGPGVPMHRVVIEWRDKTYEKPVKKGRRIVGTEIVRGREIAKEIAVSPEAYKELTGLEPRVVPQRVPVPQAKAKETRPVRPWRNPKNKGKNNKKNKQQAQGRKPVVERVNHLSGTQKTTSQSQKPGRK